MSAKTPITKAIVPTAEQSGPLTREELTPQTALPSLVDGINLDEARRDYLAALEGKDPESIPLLADVVGDASRGTLRRDIRILIDLDTRVHERMGYKTYEAYYAAITGRKTSRSTIWRRRLHGEFALLLGAQGRPDLLPSQRQCELLRKNLTRQHSLLVLLQFSNSAALHRMGENKLLETIEAYRQQNDIPKVGECIEKEEKTSRSSTTSPDIDPETHLLKQMSEILKSSSQVLMPAMALSAILRKLNGSAPEHIEIASRLADAILACPGPSAAAGRACLAVAIAEAISSTNGGQADRSARET